MHTHFTTRQAPTNTQWVGFDSSVLLLFVTAFRAKSCARSPPLLPLIPSRLGGSVKDRVARFLVREGEASGKLVRGKGGTIVEGTGGNTGIGLAVVANALGYRTVFAMPEYISRDKVQNMQTFGAEVHLQPGVGYDDPK